MSHVTRRQHYVWRYHLAAWAVDGKVAVHCRDGRSFRSNPANVAVERDFYKLPNLTPNDLAFIDAFIDHLPQTEAQKASARRWLTAPRFAMFARRSLGKAGALTPEAEAEIERFQIETGEQMMGAIEEAGRPWIDRLRAGDASFWPGDDRGTIPFSHFIAVQHLRTKRIVEVIERSQFPPELGVAQERVWPVIRDILAESLGYSIFADRRNWRLRILRAGGAEPFITTDQPLMNLLKPVGHDDMALFYPVGPRVAVLLEHRNNTSCAEGGDDLGDDQVRSLNRRMFDYRRDQAISNDLDILKALAAG